MLKIKSNTNEFTIIFFWEDSKENKCWKIICSALSVQHPFSVSAFFFLFASAPHLSSFFCFCFSSPNFHSALLFFSFGCPLFFSPNVFVLLSSTSFFSSFFSPYVFKGQPKICCSPKISLQPKRVALLSWSQMACLKTKRDPLFMPILKPKKKKFL